MEHAFTPPDFLSQPVGSFYCSIHAGKYCYDAECSLDAELVSRLPSAAGTRIGGQNLESAQPHLLQRGAFARCGRQQKLAP